MTSPKPALSHIEEGMVLGGDYEIVRASSDRLELGAGSMGAVYCARDLRLQRNVVIKTIQMQQIQGERERREFLERFMKESVIAAACRDPAIVTLYRASEPDETGFAWYAMEAVENAVDLKAWLEKHID